MEETSVDTALEASVTKDVPCEGDQTKGLHPADNYFRFQCEHCGEVLIGAQCDTCDEEIAMIMRMAGSLPCLSCTGRSSLEAYSKLGPVR